MEPCFNEQHQNLDQQPLNVDLCLKLMISYLDVEDLLNVADTCTQMKRAAELTFSHQYGRYPFCIGENNNDNNKEELRWDTFNSTVFLRNPKSGFQLLRCFGHLISKLQLKCNKIDTILPHLDECMTKYCANYLTELKITDRNRSFKHLETSFPNIENVQLLNCDLDKSITKFNERFPKMRKLELAHAFREYTHADEQSCIMAHFPHLEQLSIAAPMDKCNFFNALNWCGFQEENILSALQMNPNLRSLSLHSRFPLRKEFLREVSVLCESLETLQISGLHCKSKVHFKNVKHFKLADHCCRACNLIPFTFDALEIFNIKSYKPLESFIIEFIRNNPTIKKLKFLSFFVKHEMLTPDNLIEMRKSLEFIEEIEFAIDCSLAAKNIPFEFLVTCQSLKKLVLNVTFESFFL